MTAKNTATPVQNSRPITITQIAELCGTSKQVVGSILRGGKTSARFSRETYEKVTGVAQKYNYRPNRTSVNLASKKHNNLTVLFGDFYRIPHNMMNFLVRHAEVYGQSVNLEVIKGGELPRCVSEDATDGVIIFEDLPTFIMDGFRTFSIPHVLVNTSDTTSPNSITFDEEGMMRQAMHYFAEEGRKQPIMVVDNMSHAYDQRRLGTILSDYGEYGLLPPIVMEGSKHMDPGAKLQQIVTDSPNADCIFISNYFNRYAPLVEKLCQQGGYSIAFEFPAFHHYQLPVVEFTIHQKEVPEKAVDMLNEFINGTPGDAPVTMSYNMERAKSATE